MTSDEQIREAVDRAKDLLKAQDICCSTSTADLKAWFEDRTLDDIIDDRLLVVHELMEIEEVRKMGLQINKRTVVDNLEKVDIAHQKAMQVELVTALTLGDRDHIESRLHDIEMWIADDRVTPSQRKNYKRMLVTAKKMAEIAPVAGRIVKAIK